MNWHWQYCIFAKMVHQEHQRTVYIRRPRDQFMIAALMALCVLLLLGWLSGADPIGFVSRHFSAQHERLSFWLQWIAFALLALGYLFLMRDDRRMEMQNCVLESDIEAARLQAYEALKQLDEDLIRSGPGRQPR